MYNKLLQLHERSGYFSPSILARDWEDMVQASERVASKIGTWWSSDSTYLSHETMAKPWKPWVVLHIFWDIWTILDHRMVHLPTACSRFAEVKILTSSSHFFQRLTLSLYHVWPLKIQWLIIIIPYYPILSWYPLWNGWLWVKTLVPSEPQNSWDLWMFIPLKMYL